MTTTGKPRTRIGFLHPGSMGVSLAASVVAAGNDAVWASDDRSTTTRARAQEHGLSDVQSLQRLCTECDGIVSICPPAAAETVARDVAACGFAGVFVDANAISPGRAQVIAQTITDGGGRYVDGGVIGGPAWTAGKTFLHLSGEHAEQVPPWFAGGLLETNVLGAGATQASALKMCFAAYTKGTSALFLGILATAEALDVRQALVQQWALNPELVGPLAERAAHGAGGVTSKAWRWIDEMEEISKTFEDAGLSGGFHQAAADVFRRIESLRDADDPPVDDVVRVMLQGR